MKHWKYLKYVIKHKWFVLCACCRRGLVWQGIIHDWSKFLPSEWRPYAEFFYGPTKEDREQSVKILGYDCYPAKVLQRAEFDKAWLKHQHRSPHHYQHWILREDSGKVIELEMPTKYALEMICDWEGAGRAITGKTGGTLAWYIKNRDNIKLHQDTRKLVESELEVSAEHQPIGLKVVQ